MENSTIALVVVLSILLIGLLVLLILFLKMYKQRRKLMAAKDPNISSQRVKAWQVHSYGENMQLTDIRMPIITTPTEVVVKIDAASVNPIDVLMKDGYCRTILNILRWKEAIVLPLTLGHDFSGTITEKAPGVRDFDIGDKVYGVIPVHRQGSHAEYAVVECDHIVKQPTTITHIEAASLPYTFLTAYAALWLSGGLRTTEPKGLKIIVLGAAGGVGVCAVQMLRAVDATIIATCSTDAVPMVKQLGANFVFDYRDPNYINDVASHGGYDIILDAAGSGYKSIPNTWKFDLYISLDSPLPRNIDAYGVFCGSILSLADFISTNIGSLFKGRTVKWGFFTPSKEGLQFMDKLVRDGKLRSIVQQTFKFSDLPQSYEVTKAGHLRGKIVVEMLAEDNKE